MDYVVEQVYGYLRQLLHWEHLLQIFFIWLLVYGFLRFTEGTRGAGILKGIALFILVFLVIVSALARHLGLQEILYILKFLGAASATALIIIFQPELRRALVRLGETPIFGVLLRRQTEDIEEIARAVMRMSKNKVGALIAVEREVGLRTYIEGGVPLDAEVRSAILTTIFYPGTELHDGAVVIRQGRIAAAGCLFPLSDNPNLGRQLGTRHRAGVGITEETDAFCVIVSEQTGVVSIAHRGEMERDLDRERLTARMRELYAQLEESAEGKKDTARELKGGPAERVPV